MRILDRNQDFYDYFQNIYVDDTFVFDRRSSYNLTLEEFIGRLSHNSLKPFALLQACNKFWLFSIDEIDMTASTGKLNFICSWENYTAKRELLKLSQIDFYPVLDKNYKLFFQINEHEGQFATELSNKLIDAINIGLFRELTIFNNFSQYKQTKGGVFEKEVKCFPILKGIGVAANIDPRELYTALEEYFSLEKTALERTESIGLTNSEKITNHGFGVKTSFRHIK